MTTALHELGMHSREQRHARWAMSRVRHWPPPPSVEDEHISLDREAGRKVSDQTHEVPERGTIDQDSVLVDAMQQTSPSSTTEHDRSNSHSPASATIFTPPTTDDEGSLRGRTYGSYLVSGTLPEMRRERSPYHHHTAHTTPATTPSQRDTPAQPTREHEPLPVGRGHPWSHAQSLHLHGAQKIADLPHGKPPQNNITQATAPPLPRAKPWIQYTSPSTSASESSHYTGAGSYDRASIPERIESYDSHRSSVTKRVHSYNTHAPASTHGHALPYPLDDGAVVYPANTPYPAADSPVAMPEERNHQYFPVYSGRRSAPIAIPNASRRPAQAFTGSSSGSEAAQSLGIASIPRVVNTLSSSDSSQSCSESPKKGPPAASISLPPCVAHLTGKQSWYSLQDCPGLLVCSGCFEAVFLPSRHGGSFRQCYSRSDDRRHSVRCDFANTWLRLAWLLTLQRQAPDLGLLKSIQQHLDQSDPCPDRQQARRPWMTILDDTTRRPLRDFHVCSTDTKAIEILMPLLQGYWVPYPSRRGSYSEAESAPRLCSLRATNNSRFATYIDQLTLLHERAFLSPGNSLPRMEPFAKLVKRKIDLDECPRDNILQGAKWYYIPSVPELTVCEDCHDDVVAPLLRVDTDLAMRFNLSPQYISASGRGSRESSRETGGSASCTLYSPRMRRYLQRAVADNDLKYLARKAKDRRKVEMQLQAEAQPLIARLQGINTLIRAEGSRLSKGYLDRLEDEKEQLGERLQQCREEWADWE